MCCCGDGGQPRRETGASEEPAEGALHPPAPLPLGGVPDSPCSGSGMSLCIVMGLPAVSRELPQLALTWAFLTSLLATLPAPHLGAALGASGTPHAARLLPVGSPGGGHTCLALPWGCWQAELPPPSLQLQVLGGLGLCISSGAHCVGRVMAPTPVPVVVSRGIPPDFCSDVCCKHTSPGGCAWAWGLSVFLTQP